MTEAKELPEWVRCLDLAPHPEGGFYRETWRSEMTIGPEALPPDYGGPRSAGTAILFVLMPGQQSAWHTVRSAELWLHHRGSPLILEHGPDPETATQWILGPDVEAGQHPRRWPAAGTGPGPARRVPNRAWSAASWCPASTSPTSTSGSERRGARRGLPGRRPVISYPVLHATSR